ncbi:MAG: MFS transporter [Alphaproteobacteria bacterium]
MTGARLILVLCTAEVAGMAGFATFPALLPTFLAEWRLSNTEAGWISGIYYLGYVGLVPVLVSLTDRVDPRRIYLGAMALSAVAMLAFGLAATGFWSALGLRVLAGVGLAGTYMPGLKILSDHIEGPRQSRAIAFYTASFSIGASLSFLLSGEIAEWLDWRWAFALAALGPAAATALVALTIAPAAPPPEAGTEGHLLDFRPVFANRRALAYILAYGAHSWELFAYRSWLVAFLVFSQGLQRDGGAMWSATVIAALVNLLGWPSSVLGNELASRFGRARVVALIMAVSALVAAAIGFSAPLPYVLVVGLCLLYGVTVIGDSGALTAGAIAEAEPGRRGATMAVHSTVGFSGAFIGPLVFGVVLDVAGGGASALAWGLAFLSMGLGAALGPLAIAVLLRRR